MICTQCFNRQLRRDTDLHGQSGDITCSCGRTKNVCYVDKRGVLGRLSGRWHWLESVERPITEIEMLRLARMHIMQDDSVGGRRLKRNLQCIEACEQVGSSILVSNQDTWLASYSKRPSNCLPDTCAAHCHLLIHVSRLRESILQTSRCVSEMKVSWEWCVKAVLALSYNS